MLASQWIVSDGGPLICVEQTLAALWGGISALTVPIEDLTSDYDRICQKFCFLFTVSLSRGQALALGEAKLDTAFWRSQTGELFIVQISTCEEHVDIGAVLDATRADDFENPRSTTIVSFASPDIVIFNSAASGAEAEGEWISTTVEPGSYRIITQWYERDPRCSLVLHRFDRFS